MRTALIIDDSSFMRNWLKSILESHSFKVIAESNNGIDGIRKYSEHLPDIVLLDVVMPKMNDTSALEQLLLRHPEAKVIICSSLADKQLIDQCARLGAFDFVQKPNLNRISDILAKIHNP
ncbi:response regulator [Halobacillus sp. A5]|uniref:response regulator n=1 Tax=Halobacillus sp. A5 TaxID=2880263 RepID=UPI0020A6812C|nr:response regulator [Halobacillus sp. A5]MCP3026629.1 response regulator [Halobacillus sp. A5]